VRNLNRAGQAPIRDCILARHGKISTRELVRRGKQAEALRESREREAQAAKVCQAICDMLDRKQWSSAFGEPLVDEARRYLAFAEAQELVPDKPLPPVALPLHEMLERLWPKDTGDAIEDINRCAESLVRFVIAALPDSISRHRALQLALDKQIR
jgi:hypothetical protein